MRSWAWGLAGSVALVGCGLDSPSGYDAVTVDEGERRLETVSVLVNLVVAAGSSEPFSEHVGRHLHPRHLAPPMLRINGEPWVAFDNADAETQPSSSAIVVDGIALLDAPVPALLIADLSRAPRAAPESLEKLGDWVALLDRYLGVGRYVADLAELRIEPSEDIDVAFELTPRIELGVAEGDVAAHLGEITLPVRFEETR